MEITSAQNLTLVMASEILPVTVLICLEIVCGIVGNILILIVYYKWYKMCNFRCIVLSMAWIDLLSCFTTLPGEVYSQQIWYQYDNEAICKAKSFFNVFTVWASGLLLLLLAYDRNRKICHTLHWQLQGHAVKRISIVIVVFSLLVSSPTTVFWGIQEYEFVTDTNTTIQVSVCEKDDSYTAGDRPFIFILSGLVVPMAIIMFLTLILNLCTGRKLLVEIDHYGATKVSNGCLAINLDDDVEHCRSSSVETRSESDESVFNKRPDRRFSFPASRDTLKREHFWAKHHSHHNHNHIMNAQKSTATDGSFKLDDIPEADHNSHSLADKFHFISHFRSRKHHSHSDADVRAPSRARQLEQWRRRVLLHKLRSRRRKTFIMLTLSAVFIVTTTLYLILTCFVARTEGIFRQLTIPEKVVFMFFWRMYFINSLINPILYGCMDLRFRKGLRKLFHFKRRKLWTKLGM